MWSFLPVEVLLGQEEVMPQDPECSTCRNVYDLQRIAAIKTLDRMIADAGPDGYTTDRDGLSVHVDALLDRRAAFVEYLRTSPHA
jgi:hypothetical protein